MISTDVVVMNALSISRERYFAYFFDETSGRVSAFHMSSNDRAVELVILSICWLDIKSGCTVTKTVLDGRKNYTRGPNFLEA